jgi:hypothetical protein
MLLPGLASFYGCRFQTAKRLGCDLVFHPELNASRGCVPDGMRPESQAWRAGARDHAAEHGRCNMLHDFRLCAGADEQREQASQDDCHRHCFGGIRAARRPCKWPLARSTGPLGRPQPDAAPKHDACFPLLSDERPIHYISVMEMSLTFGQSSTIDSIEPPVDAVMGGTLGQARLVSCIYV